MTASIPSKLFQPIAIGFNTLQHRVVLTPLTRFRATKKTHVPINPLVKTYYSQRSSTPGTLLITEATFIAPQAGGYDNVPGIWSQEQIAAWKEITTAVHANNSFIFLQLWALGRAATPTVLSEDSLPYIAPSPIALSSQPDLVPRELTTEEIKEYIQLYAQAAKNAVHEAGFDGVEIHGANGYLVHQFFEDVSNKRTDEYGGSVEARSRFGLEVVDAVVDAVGAHRTGIRVSPWTKFQDMGMTDPIPQYTHFISSLKSAHPELAYLHAVEAPEGVYPTDVSIGFLRKIWGQKLFINAGGYNRESAMARADAGEGLVAFGRHFIANPDLPIRLRENIPLTPYNRKTFYTPGDHPDAAVGYVDYPFAEDTRSTVRL
ncbi:uncharacterized protein LACBIDRAFT_191617 [Laccaria bicolor S238N-H82]|uniref:Predicted protein n=1 Tax=Laccaria bicolor (strain S238N-H82 / ATCC MYA-4686) TaxID=486041 RepID=B0DQI8_LACBS|nr:uncharacterized protein LACBIDRAFT_191617 [Laccaria bicolor S238N-H82]EDR03120.1 predicted protein [Laccaria bicolor S238N-H82]|eukprot:XP_001886261.1 predicted protein [Laccaria bicolor S238N-H82]